MLKWAVNQPRPSYLGAPDTTTTKQPPLTASTAATATATAAGALAEDYSQFHAAMPKSAPRAKQPRKSNKENQLTSTPLPASTLPCRTPRQLPPTHSRLSPWQTPVASSLRCPPASTLPTFEAEYSPSTAAIIPGPLLALRGLGIPDSYFEQPRYLEQKPLPSRPTEQSTLSSSQMGDVTLERMIDAILESTRKPRPALRTRPRPRQRLRVRQRQRLAATALHSPTYRPAYDPASELCEYWQSPSHYAEREVCSPLLPSAGQRHKQLQLQRQRGVRRKRKLSSKISSSVRQSAQKLLAAARSAQKPTPALPRHISPDSGHNSTSDFEEELACPAEALTKRRLSFSFHESPYAQQ